MKTIPLLLSISILFVTSCKNDEKPKEEESSLSKIELITPGLGEYMSMVEYHHTNLDKAIKTNNYQRGSYEIDELMEVFEKVEKLHNNHEKLIEPAKTVLPKLMYDPLKDLKNKLEANDTLKIKEQFSVITANCNSCHRSNNMGFITVGE